MSQREMHEKYSKESLNHHNRISGNPFNNR
jgi:hypothetical protein